MIKLILIAAFTMTSAFAANYEKKSESFTISQFANNGARIYYNCDSVETKVEQTLKKLGAIVYSVRCTGGIDRFGRFHTPARVSATFDALNSEIDGNIATAIRTVSLNERTNCHLYQNIMRGLEQSFEISKVNYGRCHKPGARTRIKFKVLKAI